MNICETCDHEKNSRDGLCQLADAHDGLAIRCAGPWAEEKLHYFRGYLDIFTTAMRGKWTHLVYFDLFAGPGLCRVRDTGAETEGSPIIALKNRHRFTKYFFVDLNKVALHALKNRVKTAEIIADISYIHGDCNVAVDHIIDGLPEVFLGFAFIDQTGKQVYLDTLRRLSEHRRIDLIINFPLPMIKRTLPAEYSKSPWSDMDLFAGGLEWRQIYEQSFGSRRFDNNILQLYKSKLLSLNYVDVRDTRTISIRRRRKSALYYLILASKHPLGNEFWNIIAKYRPDGQRGFPF